MASSMDTHTHTENVKCMHVVMYTCSRINYDCCCLYSQQKQNTSTNHFAGDLNKSLAGTTEFHYVVEFDEFSILE